MGFRLGAAVLAHDDPAREIDGGAAAHCRAHVICCALGRAHFDGQADSAACEVAE